MYSSKIFHCSCGERGSNTCLQILSLILSQLSYPRNVVMSELILDLLRSVTVNILLWCSSCLIEITNNYSRFLWGLDVYFTYGHQPYFEHVIYQWPYFHTKKFQFRFESLSELSGKRIYVRSYLHLFSTCVIHKLDIR